MSLRKTGSLFSFNYNIWEFQFIDNVRPSKGTSLCSIWRFAAHAQGLPPPFEAVVKLIVYQTISDQNCYFVRPFQSWPGFVEVCTTKSNHLSAEDILAAISEVAVARCWQHEEKSEELFWSGWSWRYVQSFSCDVWTILMSTESVSLH